MLFRSDAWDAVFGEGYTAAWPMVAARHEYVARIIKDRLNPEPRKTLLDIGCGEGRFLHKMRNWINVVGLDPSADNVSSVEGYGMKAVCGTADDADPIPADIATILWTLENTSNPRAMLAYARRCLKPGGRLVIATGSRVLVPFKKPLSSYIPATAGDLHPTRWSPKSLRNALMASGLQVEWKNSYQDSDWLVVIAKAGDEKSDIHVDDPKAVISHFEKWAELFP